jgi:hypothetical protein
MKTLCGICRKKSISGISEVCNISETFQAGTGSTAVISEFADYVEIDTHAMTCDVLTDEDLLEIVQSRTDDTNETEEVESDSVALQPTKWLILCSENKKNEFCRKVSYSQKLLRDILCIVCLTGFTNYVHNRL